MYLSKCFVDYLHYGSEAQVQEDIQICMEQTIFRVSHIIKHRFLAI